ncbi:MAG TPA: THUMP domain-containing protein, partial [Actinomycetota bacterium]|nr:THUMP domain-containing protein [Actinomycetota bacterium]
LGGGGQVEAAVEPLVRDRVAGRTFAVRAKRGGRHSFTSVDLAVALGRALEPGAAGVDLDDPQVEVAVEVADREGHVVLESLPGPGGLPIDSGGRAVALFSGGFDSPVAAWMAMRRGTALDLLVCDLGGGGQVEAAVEVARELALGWAPGREPRVHVVDLAPVVAALRARVEPRIRQVLLKRAMYRVGTLVARAVGADALVTGESLGQASTQTLRNLAVAEDAAGIPVLRPLVGMDKDEIIARARRIGTHAASERVREVCAIATGRVETAARLGDVLTAEGRLDDSFIRSAVERRREVDLLSWSPGPRPEHVLDEVPEGAVVIDVREPDEGPTVGERRLPLSRVRQWAPTLDPDATYVFVCPAGVRSEMVAEDLRRRGLRAFSLAGGIQAFRAPVA